MLYQTRQTRIGRYSEHGRVYLITTVTKNRQLFFSDPQLGMFVAQQFEEADADGVVCSLAWVVMPDHFHWLVELRQKTLSEIAARTKSKSTHLVNKALGRTGSIWQRGFHDRALRREEDLKSAARYVVMNPVRAGLVRRVKDYPLWWAIWATQLTPPQTSDSPRNTSPSPTCFVHPGRGRRVWSSPGRFP